MYLIGVICLFDACLRFERHTLEPISSGVHFNVLRCVGLIGSSANSSEA